MDHWPSCRSKTKQLARMRWLICPHPQEEGAFSIINSFYGTYIGLYDGTSLGAVDRQLAQR
jgi:hypothetical protein